MPFRPAVFTRSAFLSLALAALPLGPSFAGDLAPPPGPPAPTMKTLQQVEPRIPIGPDTTPGDATSTFRITQPGSYYLTDNLLGEPGKHGITVATLGVTIDLSGFRLRGVPGSLSGVFSSAGTGVAVRNGYVLEWGQSGINLTGNSILIERITAEFNAEWGIILGSNFPGSRISGCSAGQNGTGGISAASACLVERCSVYAHSSGTGIQGTGGSRIERCVIWNCAVGIRLTGFFGATGAFENSMFGCPVGILAEGTDARVERNQVRTSFGQVGLRATLSGNAFIDNSVTGTGDNYDFVAGTRLRLRLGTIPESIDWPCEAVLDGTLTGFDGITINADDVTLDLGGQALIGAGGTESGVRVSGARRNIVVRNGVVRSWGGHGVDASAAENAALSDLRVSNCGLGVIVGNRSVIRDCQVIQSTGDNITLGYASRAERCTASGSTNGSGIVATGALTTITDCHAAQNANAGILSQERGTVRNCTAGDNGQSGIIVRNGGVVEGCLVSNTNISGVGVDMDTGGGATIRNNDIRSCTTGVRIVNAGGCRLEGNHVRTSITGYQVTSSGNSVFGNSASNSGTAFSIAANNAAGPVVTSVNIGAATNPFANISH